MLSSLAAIQHNAEPICLFGDVVQEDGSVLPDQYVLIVAGRIQSVSGEKPDSIKKPNYTLADDELIFPAFLDLHTHSSYNMLPLWHSPYWAWDNRFQWRGNATYKQKIGGVNKGIAATYGHGTKIYQAYNAFSELMAIAGGTTVLQENAHLDTAGYPTDNHILIRSTGSPSDMGLSENEQIVSITDFFEPDPYTLPRDPYQDTSRWGVKTVGKGMFDGASFLADFALSVSGTRTRGTIVHLAEGRSGYLQTVMGHDRYTRAEFETFKNFITDNYDPKSKDEVAKVRNAHLLLIHGCGMNTVSDDDLSPPKPAEGSKFTRKPRPLSTIADTISFLKTYGIGIIWSPVSNLLLYQDTTNVLPLLDAGVPVVLGTDWTPSGSKSVWDEAKFAADFLEAQKWKGNASRTCFQAITSVAADCLGLPLGRVKNGNLADLVVIRRPTGAKRGDALATFRQASDANVRGVFVNGQPLYGDTDFLKQFGVKPSPLPGEAARTDTDEPSVVASKSFCLPDDCEITVDQLSDAIKAADYVVGKNRPRFLGADDADYQARMQELRDWVTNYDPKRTPHPIPQPPPPSGLAPSELEWMYNPSLDPTNRMDNDVVDFLGRCAPCRNPDCAVPQRHPYYHAEVLAEGSNSYGFRNPCMPVVPVLTNKGQLFVMGDYPTAKFTARSTGNEPVITGSRPVVTGNKLTITDGQAAPPAATPADDPQLLMHREELNDVVYEAHGQLELSIADDVSPDEHQISSPDVCDHSHDSSAPHAAAVSRAVQLATPVPATMTAASKGKFDQAEAAPRPKNQFFVPVGDVFAPMQDANYFDGYKVRNVAAGVFFQNYYLKCVGVDINTQVWLTNMIKCFLFHQSMAASYEALGWNDVKVEQSYSELLPVAKACSNWINEEVDICQPKLVLTVGKPPCTLLHNLPFQDAGLQGRVYNTLLGTLLPANDSKLETAIAKKLNLSSKYSPPFPPSESAAKAHVARSASRTVSSKADYDKPQPVSIKRVGPWGKYNVFHMLHPQAVMMSQTGVVTGLISAIQQVLGSKSNGLSMSELQDQIETYLKKKSIDDLIAALPYGQRDQFQANAQMLERHAVTLANLADVLVDLKLVIGGTGDAVLKKQAEELANSYHLADSQSDELKRLTKLRTDNRDRLANFTKPSS